ncbi:WhiB family transcriptional regulator [Agromyces tardus]|nr:WhiB family transcriptional regulator [Agromyces tardus]
MSVAFQALKQQMLRRSPACRNDDRFVADELEAVDQREMAELCALCPLRAACAAYAAAERPAAGFWAGIKYPRPLGRPRKD